MSRISSKDRAELLKVLLAGMPSVPEHDPLHNFLSLMAALLRDYENFERHVQKQLDMISSMKTDLTEILCSLTYLLKTINVDTESLSQKKLLQ